MASTGEQQQRSLLEGKSLMALCLLAHEHGVDTDACETKAAVIQALLASGNNAVGGLLPRPPTSAPTQAAPAWGVELSPDAAQAAGEEPSTKRLRKMAGTSSSTHGADSTSAAPEQGRSATATTAYRTPTAPHGPGASPAAEHHPGKRSTETSGTSASPRGAGSVPPEGCPPSKRLRETQGTSSSPRGAGGPSLPERERFSAGSITTAGTIALSHHRSGGPSSRARVCPSAVAITTAGAIALSPDGSGGPSSRARVCPSAVATTAAEEFATLLHGAGAIPPERPGLSAMATTAAEEIATLPHGTGASPSEEAELSAVTTSADAAAGTSCSTRPSPPEGRGALRKRLRETETPGSSSAETHGGAGALAEDGGPAITTTTTAAAGAPTPPHGVGARASLNLPQEEEDRSAMTTATTATAAAAAGAPTPPHGAGATAGLPQEKGHLTSGGGAAATARPSLSISTATATAPAAVNAVANPPPPDEIEGGPQSAMTNAAALRSLAQFVPGNQYLFFATVSRGWRAAWGRRPALTSHVSPDSSLSQLRASLRSGLPRHGVDLCTSLARLGKLHLLRFSRTQGYRYNWNWRTTATLARVGDLKLLKVAVRNGCEWNETTTASAARGGHVDLLRWALKNGCPYDATLCAGAARGGHLTVLRGARKRNFPWDTRTTLWAAAGGHIRVLKWARRNGCRWKLRRCFRTADEHGHAHVKEWIQRLRRWCSSGSSRMLVVGDKNGK